ncbi:MAG: undecaprenyldiphospho-muramoylpentapeptide beta-N-acetylglucosaminyltransferase [Neisseriaceae bacterium]
MNTKKVFITAGGTGGHVFPALAVAYELINQGYDVIWVGSFKGIENEIVPKNDIHLEKIAISGLRKRGIVNLIKLPFILSKALYQAYKIVRLHKPNVVISFGGYASFPVSLIAKLLNIALIIHEQNSVSGLTNRILSKLANFVLVAYRDVFPGEKTILVGNPVRKDILQLKGVEKRYRNRSGGLKVLVLGGSLGAKVFNDNLPYVFEHLPNIESVIHQIGKREIADIQQQYDELKINAKVVSFIDNMADTYSDIDLIICRAGALTVSEICAVGLAAIFIPYPHAVDDHQKFNVLPLVADHAALMVLQQDFTIQKMISLIKNLTRETCLKMALQAQKHAIIDSQSRIVEIAKKFL